MTRQLLREVEKQLTSGIGRSTLTRSQYRCQSSFVARHSDTAAVRCRHPAKAELSGLLRTRQHRRQPQYSNSRPIGGPCEVGHLPLRSSLQHTTLVLVVFAVGAALYLTSSRKDDTAGAAAEEERPIVLPEMSSAEVPSGYLGNLSAEQEEKLRQFWQAIAKVCGWAAVDSVPAENSANEQRDQAAKNDSGKWRFGLFRKNEASGADADDDKFGLNRQFNEVLAEQSAESIRETLWSMVKHDHPDVLALRFLRARKWDVQKALVMFIAALNWRHSEMHVDDDIMKNGEAGAAINEHDSDAKKKTVGHDFMEQLRMGKSFLHGCDKEGRPICVVRVRLHRNGDQCTESIEQYTVHIIETARLLLSPPIETATIVFDMTGFTLANMDYAPVKFMIKCFEANYPESLGAVLIHNAPWVFQGIWRIIRGWLDPVVAGKVHFTNGRSGLEQFIEPSRIIKELGGDEDWEYKYEEPMDGENRAMDDTSSKQAILDERAGLVEKFEEATRTWIQNGQGDQGKKAADIRTELAAQMRLNYWKLDPYVRARSIYDRQGIIKPGGSVEYYPAKE